ncbi:TraA family conjugative transfer protein [Rubrivivax gelatinosus]|uniref:TraA family conjugative transfer protein n=1 Tax=Rubrivivax gelatinosus TaxID=28068 RepID=UPI0003069251|nr:TraA family conjugative transfer protein [Rubrivivax gelatinosus]MBG6083006.1 conjugal transfer pilus assembly protein TraA [Rubrivivax gelatinosus]
MSKFIKAIGQRRLAVTVAALAVTGAAVAGTGSGDFDAVTTRLQNWMQGSLGKTFALGALAVGLAIGVVKQSVMSVVTGAAVALSASIGPTVLTGIFTATM